MRIGILSDTHDHTAAMLAGVSMLRSRGAEIVLHCGDIGGEACIDQLVGFPAAFVWGNNDWDRTTLGRYAQEMGVTCHGTYGDLTIAGRRIALIHGDDAALFKRIVAENQHDYLLQGHTHVRNDSRSGRTRLINPGALYRATEKTVAILDLVRDELEFLKVNVPDRRRSF